MVQALYVSPVTVLDRSFHSMLPHDLSTYLMYSGMFAFYSEKKRRANEKQMSNTIRFFLEEILNVLCPEFVSFPPRCGRDNPTLSLIGEVSFETICLQFSKILVNLNHGVNYERVSE